jgi:hypothetical protein
VFLVKDAPAAYSYNATYFLLDNTRKTDKKDNVTDESLFLELPA